MKPDQPYTVRFLYYTHHYSSLIIMYEDIVFVDKIKTQSALYYVTYYCFAAPRTHSLQEPNHIFVLHYCLVSRAVSGQSFAQGHFNKSCSEKGQYHLDQGSSDQSIQCGVFLMTGRYG